MITEQSRRAKGLGVIGAVIMALVIGAWTLPSGAEKEGTLGVTPDADDGQAMTIDINFPAGEIQDGQFCQAYALVWNATSPYTFTWWGQFTNADGQVGPLGEDQIVNGNTSMSRDEELWLKVRDSSDPPKVDSTDHSWTWGEFNDECEA